MHLAGRRLSEVFPHDVVTPLAELALEVLEGGEPRTITRPLPFHGNGSGSVFRIDVARLDGDVLVELSDLGRFGAQLSEVSAERRAAELLSATEAEASRVRRTAELDREQAALVLAASQRAAQATPGRPGGSPPAGTGVANSVTPPDADATSPPEPDRTGRRTAARRARRAADHHLERAAAMLGSSQERLQGDEGASQG